MRCIEDCTFYAATVCLVFETWRKFQIFCAQFLIRSNRTSYTYYRKSFSTCLVPFKIQPALKE